MSAAAAPVLNDTTLLPQPPGGLGAGSALALLAHAALVAALSVSVQWRSQPAVEVVAAELWAAVPQRAAAAAPEPVAEVAPEPPRPAPPPPPAERAAPREPDIALERQRREREAQERREQAERERAQRERQQRERAERERDEREKAQREKQQRERAERQQREAEQQRLAQQREENLRRMMGQAGAGTGSSGGTAAQDAAPSLAYGSRLIAHIKPNIVFTDSVSGNPTAEVEVRTGPSGSIIARRLVRSSGFKEWDEAVLRAIDRTAVLPRDSDGRVPPVLIIKFRPND